MAQHKKIELNSSNLNQFLNMLRASDAAELIKECFSAEDMKDAIKFIFNKRNFPTNQRLERFMNRKAKLEIPSDN